MATIDDMVARLRAVAPRVRETLPEIAAEVRNVILENVAAQRGPDGTPWPPTKDGKPALQGTASALTAQVVGGVVLLTLDGPEARHHLGIARGRVKRPVLPSKGIPAPVAEAIRRVVIRKLEG